MGEWLRDEELMIRNRLEHTRSYTHILQLHHGPRMWAKKPTTKYDGRGGGLTFSLVGVGVGAGLGDAWRERGTEL